MICIPLEGVRSTDHYGVYGELNDRGRCTDRKTAVKCSKLYVSVFLGLLHTKSIYVAVVIAKEKQTSGPWTLKGMHLQLLFSLLIFQRSVQIINFIIFLKV